LENHDESCRETLRSIGRAIGDLEFADKLIATGDEVRDQFNIQPFGFGRQHENCKPLVDLVRQSMGTNELESLVRDLTDQGAIDMSATAKTREALKRIWLAADAIHALSSVPYMGDGINATLSPVIGKLAPSLMQELEAASLGKERRNASPMEYQPRIDGRPVVYAENTSDSPSLSFVAVTEVKRSAVKKVTNNL
jgi:hypothetical protein